MAFFLFTIMSAMEKLRVKHFALSLITVFTVTIAFVACGPAGPTPEAATEEPPPPTPTQVVSAEEPGITESSDGYPAPSNVESEEEGYPAPSPTAPSVSEGESYPPPTRVVPTEVTSYPEPEGTREGAIPFAFERPINAGDTVIRGVGPAGLQISIVNVTLMGEEIATTQVGEDGQFEVEVPALEPGVRIGLTADIGGTDLEAQIEPGEGARNVPQVGFFFDTIVINNG